MPATTVTVVGTIVAPNGYGVAGGTISAVLNAVGRVEVGAQTGIEATRYEFPIAADGTVSFEIVPNDIIEPDGTWYTLTYHARGQEPWSENVIVGSSPDPVEIGDLEPIGTVPETAPVFRFPLITDALLPVAAAEHCGKAYRRITPDNEWEIIVCLGSSASTWSWVRLAGGGF